METIVLHHFSYLCIIFVLLVRSSEVGTCWPHNNRPCLYGNKVFCTPLIVSEAAHWSASVTIGFVIDLPLPRTGSHKVSPALLYWKGKHSWCQSDHCEDVQVAPQCRALCP